MSIDTEGVLRNCGKHSGVGHSVCFLVSSPYRVCDMMWSWTAINAVQNNLICPLPVVPARGGAEVALKIYIYKTFLIYRTCMRRAPAKPARACTLRKWCPVSHVTFEAPLRTSRFTLHTSHSTLHTSHCTLPTAHSTVHTSHFTVHTSHFTLHTSHCTLHTPHFTLHSSRPTLHTALFTLHTSSHLSSSHLIPAHLFSSHLFSYVT